MLATGIGFPTVPEGKARVRETLRAETLGGPMAPGASIVVVEPYQEGTLVPEVVAALQPRPVRVEAIDPRDHRVEGGALGEPAEPDVARSRHAWVPSTSAMASSREDRSCSPLGPRTIEARPTHPGLARA